jgi:aspartate kinase
LIVMKFGGTSVADAERIRAAAEIVRGRLPRRPVVVVSALAGVTDLLVQAVVAAKAGEREAQESILADLGRRHRWAVSGAVEDASRRTISDSRWTRCSRLRQLLRSVRILGEGTHARRTPCWRSARCSPRGSSRRRSRTEDYAPGSSTPAR